MAILYSAPCPICDFNHNRPSDQLDHATEKACEACCTFKPLSLFPRNSGSWDGHRKICLDCATAEKAQLAAEKVVVAAAKRPPMAPAASGAGRYGSFADKTPEWIAGWARSALKRPTVRILDTETTGHGPRWGGGIDEIVEICIIDGSGAPLLNTLVKPKGKMHPVASAISGLTDEMLGTCRPFSTIAEQVHSLLHGNDVIIFNALYDMPLVAAAFAACGQLPPTYEARCAMRAYHTFSGRHAGEKWTGLEAARQEMGIPPQGDAHRALGDCLSTLALLRCMAEYAPVPAMPSVARA